MRGRVIGVLDIESSQPDYFTPDQQNILTLVARRIGTAVENARLFEHERNQAETLLLLNEVGREANSTLRVEEVLRRAAELTKRADRLPDFQHFAVRRIGQRVSPSRDREIRAAHRRKNMPFPHTKELWELRRRSSDRWWCRT